MKLQTAEEVAQRFMAARKRLAPQFGQVIAVPDWEELPEGLRALTVAAMEEAMTEEQIEAIARRAVTVTAEPSSMVTGGHYWVVRVQPNIDPAAGYLPFEVCTSPQHAEVLMEQLQGLVRWTLRQVLEIL